MRWFAAGLAGTVGLVQVVSFAVAEREVQAARAVVTVAPDLAALRWAYVLVWALPWLVGAALFATGRLRRGVTVVLTAEVLLLTVGLGSALAALSDGIAGDDVSAVLGRAGGLVVWVLGLGAAVTAVLVRPRTGWREPGRQPAGWYVAVAVCAWMSVTFRTTAFAPPGAPRRFLETEVALLDGIDVVSGVALAAVVAGLLWLAPRLQPALGGVVLLTVAVPLLVSEFGGVVQVATEPFVIFTPPGVLGLVGLAGLVVTGIAWSSRELRGRGVAVEAPAT